ncbi:MAG: AI-2E family transporter [Methanothrix soehngenii]|jgi:predicted PurR-regulated permease PerM|uniref:AI-2E family transporter n=1 Tax=Methanothrix soehngenii TaxID=2223 RepID=UPI0023F36D2C|nr:AI-2E family transporter [Methanothrix soehngenii]MCK9585797.1 AI-2E family transporter [Methanothrix soehngenii]MDD3973897.1 AI-2E family transporter [Methanothrix soehngenii]MDD5257170.1 AI-2E family transporter [Methanothrix soehngenii]
MDYDPDHWCREHKGILILALAAVLMTACFAFPFLDGIILGSVFAYVGRPIRDRFGKRKKLGSLVAAICVVVPIFLMLGLGSLEVATQIIALAKNQEALRYWLGYLMQQTATDLPPWARESLISGLENAFGLIASLAASIPILQIGRMASLGIINFLISFPICYFILLDGEGFVGSLISLLPDGEMRVLERYIDRIDRILSGIFIGTVYTSIVGSLIAAVIFFLFGIPRPIALASIVFIAGMVPVLTSWAVLVPLAVYRYFTVGLEGALFFLVISSALIYLPSELFIRPYIISTRSSLHPLLVMLSFFGGALVAGIGGFFLAPAVIGAISGIYQVRREETASSEALE